MKCAQNRSKSSEKKIQIKKKHKINERMSEMQLKSSSICGQPCRNVIYRVVVQLCCLDWNHYYIYRTCSCLYVVCCA